MVVKINQIKSFNFALVCSLNKLFTYFIPQQSLIEIVYCLDFAPNCTRIGKFSCASSGLCLSKSVFANQNERLALNCTSVEGGLCQSNPCVNNGICYDGIGNFICGCKPGWKGQTCDTESKLTHTYLSMTSLFAHPVAQPTKWRFLTKNLSYLVIFVIGLAFT